MNRKREKRDEKGEGGAGCQRLGCVCKLLKVSSAHLHGSLGDFYDILLFCLGQVISKGPFLTERLAQWEHVPSSACLSVPRRPLLPLPAHSHPHKMLRGLNCKRLKSG